MSSENITLAKKRILFPNIYRNEIYQGDDTGKKSVVIKVKKDSPDAEKLKALAAAEYKAIMKTNEVPQSVWDDRRCAIKDGDKSKHEDNHGYWLVKASNNEEYAKVGTYDRNKSVTYPTAENGLNPKFGIFYAGSYNDLIINFWVSAKQNNISANFVVIRFRDDGARIGSADSAEDLVAGLEDVEDEEL